MHRFVETIIFRIIWIMAILFFYWNYEKYSNSQKWTHNCITLFYIKYAISFSQGLSKILMSYVNKSYALIERYHLSLSH